MTTSNATGPNSGRTISASNARAFVARAARFVEMPEGDVDRFVDGLVEADLRGNTSHGIARIPPYIRALAKGVVNPRPELKVLRDFGATALLDGDNGHGVVIGQVAMDRAVEIASELGVGVVAVRNSNHAGMLAVHVLRAAGRDMIGYFTSNAPAIMAPFGGREARMSNAPFAYAIPTIPGSRSCSTWQARWSLGARYGCMPTAASLSLKDGARRRRCTNAGTPAQPWTEPWWRWRVTRAMESPSSTRCSEESYREQDWQSRCHRRFSLKARPCSTRGEPVISPLHSTSRVLRTRRPSKESFADTATFKREVDRLAKVIKDTPLADGVESILVPGEPEARTRAKHIEHGIPLTTALSVELDAFAEEIGIAGP